jgi:hypothetical protein
VSRPGISSPHALSLGSVLVSVRVSDFLRQQPGLAVLHDCALVPYGQSLESNQTRKFRVALVNLGRTTGVAEWVNRQI